MKSKETKIALIEQSISNIKDDLKTFITRHEFEPVKKMVYAFVTTVVLSVIGAILALVLK